IMIGNDQLIYVCDYAANEVIMLDGGGRVLYKRSIPHPISLAQNFKLDLYVGGEAIAPNGTDTIGAIYRISLARLDTSYVVGFDTVQNPSGGTKIDTLRRDTSIFYNHDLAAAPMKVVWSEPGHPGRRFTGIGFLPDGEYLVTRDGPDNSSFVDPDSRLLRFRGGDTLVSPVTDVVTRPSGGTSITDVRHLTSIYVFPSLYDFVATQTTNEVTFGAIWMLYTFNNNFEGWLPKFDPSDPNQRGTDFIAPYRYSNAIGVAYDRRKREVFILDEMLDSVSKFTYLGKYKSESFGKTLTAQNDLPGLNHPRGIAFSSDCTLYISDTGNRLVRRFRLSSQTTCF
ncbi:MAG TPA: hypothetical protein VKS81_00585, partial [Bacteroidota bacterium]|nr:hypothetical protein [Bacteroidota bacterium]